MDVTCLFERNRRWAADMLREDPECFRRQLEGQHPPCLWIGCSDSREPPERIVDVPPGEIFVHRNIANRVAPGDTNALAVIQYAVEALEVEHIIVCGHYGCGGVRAALGRELPTGALGRWLDPIRQMGQRHRADLDAIREKDRRVDRCCELHVAEQVDAVAGLPSVQAAWGRDQPLAVHGWIYRLADGRITDLGVSRSGLREPAPA